MPDLHRQSRKYFLWQRPVSGQSVPGCSLYLDTRPQRHSEYLAKSCRKSGSCAEDRRRFSGERQNLRNFRVSGFFDIYLKHVLNDNENHLDEKEVDVHR